MTAMIETYYIYIVECSDGTLYVGVTYDLERRLKQHNGLLLGGAKYTRSKRPVILRYYEAFPSYSLAIKREIELKEYSHRKKLDICKNS